ncbi:MAG TPA: prepilin-type N-terminal cleavage/methylation domain-containing protein [Terriglobales bacterium]|nr:prepilin-type N-terminal cleavage/methylation domain-containing protein [Terriglobales bacterium]
MSRTRGFSLLEMMMVVALIMIMATISFISLQPVLRQQRVTNAYNTVLSAMRQARDNAVAQRTSYVVVMDTTANPHTITVSPTFAGFQGARPAVTFKLPIDVVFDNEPGIPTSNAFTPDGFGTGNKAVDFGYTGSGTGIGGSSQIYFCPDGSAQDAAGGAGQCLGNFNSGVVYIARRGDVLSSRAITVWGATGRMRGWRLYSNGAGGYAWQRQ